MKNEYLNVDVLSSANNIELQQEKIKNVISLLENQCEFGLNCCNWKCGAKTQFIKKFEYLKLELKNLDTKMSTAKDTLNVIKKIQYLEKEIEELLKENELIQNSSNPNDKLKIIQNNNKIKDNKEFIEQLKTDVISFGW